MKNKIYIIDGKTYLSHINDEVHLYGLLHQLAFLGDDVLIPIFLGLRLLLRDGLHLVQFLVHEPLQILGVAEHQIAAGDAPALELLLGDLAVAFRRVQHMEHVLLILDPARQEGKLILAERLGISAEQLAYVTNSEPGHGLLFFNNVILPFADDFPKDTELYKLLTTKPSEVEHAAETEE